MAHLLHFAAHIPTLKNDILPKQLMYSSCIYFRAMAITKIEWNEFRYLPRRRRGRYNYILPRKQLTDINNWVKFN